MHTAFRMEFDMVLDSRRGHLLLLGLHSVLVDGGRLRC